MKIHGFLCGLVTAVVLAACASPGAQVGVSKTCPGNSCDVAVKVVMVGGSPQVQVDFDDIHFPRGNQNATITWMLKDSPHWKFKDTSIAPHTSAPVPGKETTSANEWRSQISFRNSSEVTYVVQNANNKATKLFYNVTVFRKSDEMPLTLDPTVTNDGL